MKWTLEYLPEALDDLESLDNSIRGPITYDSLLLYPTSHL